MRPRTRSGSRRTVAGLAAAAVALGTLFSLAHPDAAGRPVVRTAASGPPANVSWFQPGAQWTGDYGDPTSDDFNDFWGLHIWAGAASPNPAWLRAGCSRR